MSTDQLKISSIPQEDQKLKGIITTQEETPNNTKNIQQLLYKLERSLIIVNRIDYFGNAIPIGAFCNAITFIIWGFYRCHVLNKKKIDFLKGIILIFGGLGQITSGLLEFVKARSYSALLYLTLGFYCLTTLFADDLNGYNNVNSYFGIREGNSREKTLFIWAWFLIMAPLVIGSFKINIFFLIQTGSTFLYLLFRWIGEVSEKDELTDYTSGVFQLIAGFSSLYIFAYQIIDEELKKQILPCIALDQENEIDYNIVKSITATPQ